MNLEEIPEDLRCRVCLETEVNELISVFCLTSTQNKLISHMILACSGLAISTQDKVSPFICDECLGDLDAAYEFWLRCRRSWGNYRERVNANQDDNYQCRICFRMDVDELSSVYLMYESQLLKIDEMIKQFAGLEVSPTDKHPQYICKDCLDDLNKGFKFRKLCRQSNLLLRKEVQAGLTQEVTEKPKTVPGRLSNDSAPKTVGPRRNVPLGVIKLQANSPNSAPTKNNQPDKTARTKLNSTSKPKPSNTGINKKPTAQSSAPEKTNAKDMYFPSPACKGADQTTSNSKTANLPSGVTVRKAIVIRPKHAAPAEATSSGDPSPPKKVAKFSTPSEFKQLAKNLMGKSSKQQAKITHSFTHTSTLAPSILQVMETGVHYERVVVSDFRCLACNETYKLKELCESCINCGTNFTNYHALKEHKYKFKMNAFRCHHCIVYVSSRESIWQHLLEKHKIKYDRVTDMPIRHNVPTAGLKEEEIEIPDDATDDPDPLGVATRHSSVKPVDIICSSNAEPAAAISSPGDTLDFFIEFDDPTDFSTIYLDSDDDGERNTTPAEAPKSANPQKSFRSNDNDDAEVEFCGFVEDGQQTPKESPALQPQRSSQKLTRLNVNDGPVNLVADNDAIFETIAEDEYYKLFLLKGHLCCGCRRMYATQQDLVTHCRESHRELSSPTAKVRCELCFTTFKTEARLVRHVMLGTKRLYYCCRICRNLLLDNEDDFEAHRINSHPKLRIMFNKKLTTNILVRSNNYH